MCYKSGIYTVNSTPQTIAANGTLALGSVTHKYGDAIELNGNGINLTEAGYYNIITTATVSPTAAGTITLTMYKNGVAVPGAIATGAVSTAGNPMNLSFPALVKIPCCGNDATLTFVVSAAGSVGNVSVVVEKL
jgi:hypothetical protein